MTAQFKILGMCGSLRKASTNAGLVRCAAQAARSMNIDFVVADLSGLPVYSEDIEGDNAPGAVKTLKSQVAEADAIFFACPEYNYNMTPALKNALDWCSKKPGNLWKGKAAAVVGAGGGAGTARAQLSLRQSGVFLDLHFVNSPELCIKRFEDNCFDAETGDLQSEKHQERVKDMLQRLVELGSKLKASPDAAGQSEATWSKWLSQRSTPLRILGVSGALRKASTNTGLLRCAAEAAKSVSIDFVMADIGALPLYNEDIEGDAAPEAVKTLKSQVAEADAIFFACPEYNYNMTPALKNALDWCSKKPGNLWKGKAAAIVGAGGGAGTARAQLSLRQSGVFLDLHFVNSPELCIKRFEDNCFDASTGDLQSEKHQERVKDMLQRLIELTSKLQAPLDAAASGGYTITSSDPAPVAPSGHTGHQCPKAELVLSGGF